MDPVALAREIHRRRLFGHPGSPRGQAGVEALFCERFGITPTLDDFSPPAMSLHVKDANGRSVACVGSDTELWRVSQEHVERFDVIVFGCASGFDDADLMGWLPGDVITGAPQHRADSGSYYEIGQRFVFPMPVELDFEIPDLNVPRVWSYREKAFWTPHGFYLYDSTFAATVERVDAQLLGSDDKVSKN